MSSEDITQTSLLDVDSLSTFEDVSNNKTFKLEQKKKKIRRRKPKEPIMSYGIIAYTGSGCTRSDLDNKSNIRFLLYQRRDTFEYIDFLRGLWKDEEQVREMISMMTPDERERLLNYNFEDLWKDLWADRELSGSPTMPPADISAYNKFMIISKKIPDIIATTQSRTKETLWGFPKGKKNNFSENEIDCALREFSEETKIQPSYITNIINTPFVEKFQGSNGKIYSTLYYLCKCSSEAPKPEKLKTPHLIRKETLSEEALDAKWLTFTEACEKLNARRRCILSSARDYILDNL